MSNVFNLANRVGIVTPYSNVDKNYGSHDSVATAIEAIPEGLREIGLTVGVVEDGAVVEYWWKSGITDSDLIKKTPEIEFDGLKPKIAVRVSTALSDPEDLDSGNIVLSGLINVDGITLLSGDRVLVKNQTIKSENGIYIASTGNWERSDDFDEDGEVSFGTIIPILEGDTHANQMWMVSSPDPIEIGVDIIEFRLYLKLINISQGDGINITTGGGDNITKTISVKASDDNVVGNEIPVKFNNEKELVIDENDLPLGGNALSVLFVDDNIALDGDSEQHVILVDSFSVLESLIITLPNSSVNGRTFKIKDVGGNALDKNIVIDAGLNEIDGDNTILINTDYGAVELVSYNNNWYVVSFVN